MQKKLSGRSGCPQQSSKFTDNQLQYGLLRWGQPLSYITLQAVLEKDGRDYSKAFAPAADGGGAGRGAGGGPAKKRRI